jgi:hypothetical protein
MIGNHCQEFYVLTDQGLGMAVLLVSLVPTGSAGFSAATMRTWWRE